MKKNVNRISIVLLTSLLILSLLTMTTATVPAVEKRSQKGNVPELIKGQKWSRAMEFDLKDIVSEKELNDIFADIGEELKKSGEMDKFDVDVDLEGGGVGLYATTEVIEDSVTVGGNECYQIRDSAYFGGGLKIDASADVEGDGNKVKGKGEAELYAEFDLIVDQWFTTDSLALTKIEMKFKPGFDGAVKASAEGDMENMKFDVKMSASAVSKDILLKSVIEFDEPFDFLDLPVEENEEWTAEASFTGSATISGKIEAKADVIGIPRGDDIHESETIDLAEESEGTQEFEEEIEITLRSGESTTITLPDGSTTPIIPISPVGLFDFFEDDRDDYEEEPWTPMSFSVQDGYNTVEERGAFFLMRAERGVSIDPEMYDFYIAEMGRSPVKLDLAEREYDANGTPSGGDRNSSFDYTANGALWTDGEYLGFDMPTDDMNIDITDGALYEVLMKNPDGEIVYRDTFVYKAPFTQTRNYEDDYSDYEEDDYYYEEGSISPFDVPFLEGLEDMDPEDFQIKQYYAPELGVFVKSDIGFTESALQDIDDPEMKQTLSSLDMEMEPTTESEVDSFKNKRSKEYFVSENPDQTNWVLVIAGIVLAMLVVIVVLILIVRRKGEKKPPVSPQYERRERETGYPSEEQRTGAGFEERKESPPSPSDFDYYSTPDTSTPEPDRRSSGGRTPPPPQY